MGELCNTPTFLSFLFVLESASFVHLKKNFRLCFFCQENDFTIKALYNYSFASPIIFLKEAHLFFLSPNSS